MAEATTGIRVDTDLDTDLDTDVDLADVTRGFVATLDPCVVTAADGTVVWDMRDYAYLDGDRPETVHPSLWRQARLVAEHGLFEVTAGIYQIRGFDLSNMTIVEGETGVIVVDPLISAEVAAAGLALYREHRGERPVTAVIYTHSHLDHFGGVRGVLPDGHGPVPVLAPAGFLAEAASENVYAGTAMSRRGRYQSGAALPKSPTGQVSVGLGIASSSGSLGLLPPTVEITATGQELTLDGVRLVFQLTPGTEAPAEMNFFLPDHRALCMAENATHVLHNVLTLRGAQVRDARLWAHYINEAIELFAESSDVVFASHHWPTWGRERLVTYLSEQRDIYAYLHDQTLRMMNRGSTGSEIAEDLELPPALEQAWHVRGYYGSVSHNVKAIYQRYMGWFDGNPSSLWQHPPRAQATRYVELLGGVTATVAKGRSYAESGDLRFAAELLRHAVFADPEDPSARETLAEVYEQLGFGAENAIWRNFFLTGALELREGVAAPARSSLGSAVAAALTVEQLFTMIAVRIDGPRAAAEHLVIDWHFADEDRRIRTELSNGALILTESPRRPLKADLFLVLTRQQLLGLIAGRGVEGLEHTGDLGVLPRLFALLEAPDPAFAIVTP
jgi:alkyl sulfatase BDS1-like metallo-beta-lactamase superfamily hydrolase